jgi:hypothetical protein
MLRSTCAPRWRVRALALLTTLGMVMAIAAAADATPQAGSFKATGAIKFAFTVTKGKCEGQPSNLSNPSAKPGKVKAGYCFSSVSTPRVKLSCFSGDTAAIQELSGLRLSGSDSLHVRAYSYYGGNIVAGFTEFELKVSGATARGFVRVKWIDASGSPSCETTKLAFTARRG